MPEATPPAATNPPGAIAAPIRTQVPDVTVDSPPATPAAAPPATAAAPPAVQTPPASPPPAGDTSSRGPVTIGGDGEIPDDAEILQLSKGALKSRLARATRSELKERFGTDDPAAIKAQLDELAQFKAEKEAQRLAQLSEIEREKEARLRAEGERDEWRRQHEELRTSQSVRQEHSRVERLAAKHVDPAMQEFVLTKFAGSLAGKTDAEINSMTDEQIDQWFADKVKEQPKLARDYAPPAQIAPLTNGPGASAQPPPPTGAQPEKSFAPSAANPMNRHEAREEAAKLGYRY